MVKKLFTAEFAPIRYGIGLGFKSSQKDGDNTITPAFLPIWGNVSFGFYGKDWFAVPYAAVRAGTMGALTGEGSWWERPFNFFVVAGIGAIFPYNIGFEVNFDYSSVHKSFEHRDTKFRISSGRIGLQLSIGFDLTHEKTNKSEDQVQKKMIFELIARKGYQKDWSAAKLMVKNTPSYQILREKPDPLEVIRQVHRCGGIAVMAHPYLVNEPVSLPDVTMSRFSYIDRLIGEGLDGIEACYPYSKTSYGGSLTPDQIEREVRARCTDRVAVISGGTDYHADFKKGVPPQKSRNIGECGITLEYFGQNELIQTVLEKNRPSL